MSRIAEKRTDEIIGVYHYEDYDYSRHNIRWHSFRKGYDQAMQDFLKKACAWLKENGGSYWMDDYNLPTDELVEDFKNYMQDESEN